MICCDLCNLKDSNLEITHFVLMEAFFPQQLQLFGIFTLPNAACLWYSLSLLCCFLGDFFTFLFS